MGIRERLSDRGFYGALRRLEQWAKDRDPARARALAKAGLRQLDEEQRRAFVSKSLVQAIEEAPESKRRALFAQLTDAAADKLPAAERAALPAHWLNRLATRLRPRPYSDVLMDTVRAGLAPLDRNLRQMTDSRLVDLAAIDETLEQADLAEVLAPGEHPIVVGPWTMEVGFELLYWIPLLRRYLTQAGVDPARVTVISRGGVAGWYGDLANRYIELLDHMSPSEFKTLGEEIEAAHLSKKPFTPTATERDLVERVARSQGLAGYRTIYPAALFGLFRTTWLQRFGGETFLPRLDFAPLGNTWLRPGGLAFEGPYVVVKFYSSEFFEGEAVTPFVARMLRSLTKRHRVVLLNTGLQLDDHTDLACRLPDIPADRLVDVRHLLSASDNLAVQTALVANADRLYCTFGGFSYLGPLVGVDTFSFFTHTHFVSSHLDLALRAFNREGYGNLAFLPIGAMDAAAVTMLTDDSAGAGA